MSEMLFPERQRCRKCARKLGVNGAGVLLGLYCSPSCAQMAEPPHSPDDAPRECRTQHDGDQHWVFKRRYRSVSEIPERLRDDPTSAWYWCQSCGHLHIGHSRVDQKTEQFRVVDRAELADVLVKTRRHATIKDVAQALGVRPIRIREWEDPGFDTPSQAVLAKLLRVYGLKISVVFRP